MGLRSNYRKTGGPTNGELVGDNLMLLNVNATAYSAALYADSAYGLLSAFYGAPVGSGFVVKPLAIYPQSFSTYLQGSIPLFATSLRTSNSLALFTPYISQTIAPSNVALVFQMLAVVVSSP